MITAELTYVTTPRGHEARFQTRPETSDSSLVMGIIGEDEYGLKDLPPLTGWAIDIGAHIGTVAVALALDHPGLRVMALEALDANAELCYDNVLLNDLGERVHVRHGAASTEAEREAMVDIPIVYGWSKAENQPDHYMSDNRYIGGMVGENDSSQIEMVMPESLSSMFDVDLWTRIDDLELLKIDCEGCEWFFLTSPEIVRCKRIWGEFHVGRHGNAARLRELLEPTHDVEMDDTKNVGLFRATRR